MACGINLKYDFIAEVLHRAGYKTAALGKVRLPACLHSSPTRLPSPRSADHLRHPPDGIRLAHV